MAPPDPKFDDFELPSEHHRLIGLITSNSAILDQTIDAAIWVFLRAEPRIGRLITEPIVSTSRKIQLMKAIGQILCANEAALLKRWNETCSAVKAANSHRTKIVHARWGYRGHDKAICIFSFEEGQTDPIAELMPIAKLARRNDEIAAAQKKLVAFLQSVQIGVSTTGFHQWPPHHQPRLVRP